MELDRGGRRSGNAFIGAVPAAGQAVILGRSVTPLQTTKWGKKGQNTSLNLPETSPIYFGLIWNSFNFFVVFARFAHFSPISAASRENALLVEVPQDVSCFIK